MISKYTNKNGEKKLLAMIMAVVMVLVAGFIVISGSESDATVPGASTQITGEEELPTSGDIPATAAEYKITEYSELTIPGKASSAITIVLYVQENVTVKVTGTVGTGSEDVTVNVILADATCENYLATDSRVTIEAMTSGFVYIKNADYGVASSTYSKATVYGEPGVAIGISNDVSVEAQKTLASPGEVNNLSYGVLVSETGSFDYYSAGAMVLDIALDTDGQSVKVIDGFAKAQQGANIVEISSAAESATGSATITKGTQIPAVSSEGTFNGIISIIGGYVSQSAGTVDGLTNVVTYTVTAGSTAYISTTKITPDSDLKALTIGSSAVSAVTSGAIVGKVTQYQSVLTESAAVTLSAGGLTIKSNAIVKTAIAVSGGIFTVEGEVQGAVTVTGGSVIVEGVISGALSMSTAGDMNVFGVVSNITAAAAANTIKIGPEGYINDAESAVVSNIISADGVDFKVAEVLKGTVGDALMSAVATVPADETFEITGNFGLNGKNLTINGTLIIGENANVFGVGTEVITLGANGSIVYNGTIAKMMPVSISDGANSITIQGVSGYDIKFVESVFKITGSIDAIDGAVVSKVTLGTDAVKIYGILGIGEGVIFATNASGNNVVDESIVSIDGEFNGKIIAEGTVSIDAVDGTILNGSVIQVRYGLISESTNVVLTVDSSGATATKGNTNGFMIDVMKVGTGAAQEYVATIGGSINFVDPDAVGAADTVTSVKITLAGNYTVDEQLIIGKNVDYDATGSLDLQGAIVDLTNSAVVGTYVGANYQTATADTTPVITKYYTTIEEALRNIEGAKDKTIYAVGVTSVKDGFDLGDKQVLDISGSPAFAIGPETEATAGSGSKIVGTIYNVSGKLTVKEGATVNAPAAYDSTYEIGNDIVYAGLAVAIKEAEQGATIEVVNSSVAGNLTIGDDKTVKVSDKLNISGNLVIEYGATLIGGTVVVGNSTTKSTVTVDGIMDLSAGALSLMNVSGVYANGTVKVTSLIGPANGAYYADDGVFVYTTIAKAALSEDNVTIIGEASCTDAITIAEGKTLTVSEGAVASIASITLQGVGSNIVSTGKLDADIIYGTTEITISGTISTAVVAGAAGVEDYLKVTAVSGQLTIDAGILTSDVATVTSTKIVINQDATLVQNVELTINDVASSLVINGKLDAKAGVDITNNAKALVIAGELVLGADSFIEEFSVQGILDIAENKTLSTSNDVIIGTFNSLGSDVVVKGTIDLTVAGKYILAYDGVIVPADYATIFENTAFYVNGYLFVTVYAENDNIENTSVVDDDLLSQIPGLTIGTVKWVKENNTSVPTDACIGDFDKVFTTLSSVAVDIHLAIQSGVELVFDYDYYYAAADVARPVGTYNISACDNVGSKSVVIIKVIDGKEEIITDGKLVITEENVGKKIIVQASYGSAPGPTPGPTEPSEDFIVSVSYNNGKLIVSVIALDGGYIPATEVTVNFSAVGMRTILGETVPAPVTIPESFDVTDDNRSDVVNKTFELENVIGENISIMGVQTFIGQTSYGYMSLGYKP